MKKHFLWLISLSPFVSHAQMRFTVSGKIGELNAPAKVYLSYVKEGNTVTDSAILDKGAFSISGVIAAPVRATLRLFQDGMPSTRGVDAAALYLEEGAIKVTGPDSVATAVISGSTINEDFNRLQAALKPVNNKRQAVTQEYLGYTADQRKDKALMERVGARYQAIDEERKQVNKDFIKANPNTLVSLDAIRSAVSPAPEYDEIAPLFAGLSEPIRNLPAGKAFAAKLEKLKATSIGATAPDFTQNDPNGNPVSLASFRGKYVLIDFWASWCGPCRAENPNVVKLYNKYKDKRFTVLGVSLDQRNAKDKWLKAVADDHLEWTQVSDLQFWKNAVAQLYDIQAIPQNLLVNPSGKIVARNLRGDKLEKELEQRLGN